MRVTLSFSEAVSGLSLGQLTAPQGRLSGLQNLDNGRNWQVDYTPDMNVMQIAMVIGLQPTSVVDLQGNAMSGSAQSGAFAVRTVVPVNSAPVPLAPLDVKPPAPTPTLTPVDSVRISFISPPSAPTANTAGLWFPPALDSFLGAPSDDHSSMAPRVDISTPFIVLGDGAAGASGLRAIPDIGSFSVASGQSINFVLPPSTFAHSDSTARVTVEARLSDGRPLPGWLRFDPATGSLSGQPPAGLNQKLSIEIIARDDRGNRVSSNLEIQVNSRSNMNRSELFDGAPAAQRLSLSEQLQQGPQSSGRLAELAEISRAFNALRREPHLA